MHSAIRIALFAIVLAVASCAAFGEVTMGEPIKLTPYKDAHRSGHRITFIAETVEFHVPRFAHATKLFDADYGGYYVRYGPTVDKLWLKFMFGALIGGYSPDDLQNPAIKWTARHLICEGSEVGTDWRGSTLDGHRWRHIGIAFGFADYQNVPGKAADYFDKILDTVSCGRDPFGKH
jgi:hypothetical protein